MKVQHEITLADPAGAKSQGTVSGDSRHWVEGGFSRTECSLVLRLGDLEFHGVGTDFFNAFCHIREQLAERRLFPICYGASRRVYPSGMSRDMGRGLKAYRLEMGRSTRQEDLVSIFDTGSDVEPATVAEQKTFADAWFDQFRKKR
jgi:hypothetical protein